LSTILKGKRKPPRTAEHTAKIRAANIGRKHGPMAEETKQKLREAAIKRHLDKSRASEGNAFTE